ncbi:MAG: S-methyl-5'-thioadenosine phosphorylase [Phycisphaerae bacterium]
MSDLVCAIIGGTGVGEKLASTTRGETLDVETPYGKPSGPLLRTRLEGVDVIFLARHGEGHLLPPTAVPFRANVWAFKSLGVTHILASGAVGSLREEIRPRDLVVPDQVIDKTHRRASTFFDQPGVAAHVEFAEPFCPLLRERLLACADAVRTTVHDGGAYVCMEGPMFSTVAESRMHRAWGGDLIGMTCMPEAKLAREAEMCYALLALPTDYDCWRPHDPTKNRRDLLKEIISHAEAVSDHSIDVFRAVLKSLAATPPGDCACRHALELAIWSDRRRVPAALQERLAPILRTHLQPASKPAQ